MSLENPTYVPNLDPNNPAQGDFRKEGDDHFRRFKLAVRQSLELFGGDLATSGTSTAYTVTTGHTPSPAYQNGHLYTFRLHTGNGASATVNFDGLGAKAIHKNVEGTWSALAAGDFSIGDTLLCYYFASTNAMRVIASSRMAAWAGGLITSANNPILTLSRTGSAVNTIVNLKNTTGDLFFGHGSANTFAVGSSNDLQDGANPWFRVKSTGATIRASGATNLTVERHDAATNSAIEHKTSGGSVFSGFGAAATWAVKGDNNLATSPWLSVSATAVAAAGSITSGGTAVVLATRTLTGGTGIAAIGNLSADRTVQIDTAVVPQLGSANSFAGNITISKGTPALILSDTGPLEGQIFFQVSGSNRMAFRYVAASSEFRLSRYDASGVIIDNVLVVDRATGFSTFGQPVEFDNHATTGSGANAFIDTAAGNQLKRFTSSGRFKTAVREVPVAEAMQALKGLRFVAYKSLCKGDNPEQEFFGAIAEEVAVAEPRLAVYGRDRQPELVDYARAAFMYGPIVRDLVARVEALEAGR